MTSLIIRPARRDDLPGLMALAEQAGTGMTTVPQGETAIGERIEASIQAFAGKGPAHARDIFFLVLDDGEGVAGMTCIFPNLGEDRPFYSYRLSHIAAQSPEVNMRASTDILQLVNDFHGYTEIGTLLVSERTRGRGAGRFLSLSRFLYLGGHRERFGPNVMAEIRGYFDEDGNSPFWSHIAAKFFEISFEEADRLSAHDFRFISHLMPKFPIYVSLLPEAAQQIIGQAHTTSTHALNLLASEGFAWTRCVDIFDGGPSIECALDKVRTVQKMSRRSLTISQSHDHIEGAEPFMISSGPDTEFIAALGHGHRAGNTVVIDPETADRTGLKNNAPILAAPLKG